MYYTINVVVRLLYCAMCAEGIHVSRPIGDGVQLNHRIHNIDNCTVAIYLMSISCYEI